MQSSGCEVPHWMLQLKKPSKLVYMYMYMHIGMCFLCMCIYNTEKLRVVLLEQG